MKTFIPRFKDRLGAKLWSGVSVQYASKAAAASTAIPNGESILIINWFRSYGATGYYGIDMETPSSVSGFAVRGVSGLYQIYTIASSNTQSVNVGAFAHGKDICIAALVDRSNTLIKGWLNGIQIASTALTRNPDLSANNAIYIGGFSGREEIIWRSLAISLNSVLTDAQWEPVFKILTSDPQAPLPAALMALKGTFYSDYSPGEGLYGATTVTDNGTSGNNLTWASVTSTNSVRVRQTVPWKRTKKTWYAYDTATSAQCLAQNFGFAASTPIIARYIFKSLPVHKANISTIAMDITNTGGTDRITFYHEVNPSGLNVYTRTASTWNTTKSLNYEDVTNGGDFWFVINGTSVTYYLNGHLFATVTTTAALDLSGTCNITFLGGESRFPSRIAVWQMASIPANLLDEIRMCCRNPELDPPSLTGKLVDFPLNSDTLPLATSTTVANQGTGGGTVTLASQRSTSCVEFLKPASNT